MKKAICSLVAATAVVCSLCVSGLSVSAASTPENAGPVSTAETSHSSSSSSSERYVTDTSGSYRTSATKTAEAVTAAAFNPSVVYVNPVTHAINNVYDANGNLIPATLSSDGHFYIVPTNEGYLYIATGR